MNRSANNRGEEITNYFYVYECFDEKRKVEKNDCIHFFGLHFSFSLLTTVGKSFFHRLPIFCGLSDR